MKKISDEYSIIEDAFLFLSDANKDSMFWEAFHYLRGLIDAEWMLSNKSEEDVDRYNEYHDRLDQLYERGR